MDRTTARTNDVLAPLLADFQLVGDGVDRLLAVLTARPAPSAA